MKPIKTTSRALSLCSTSFKRLRKAIFAENRGLLTPEPSAGSAAPCPPITFSLSALPLGKTFILNQGAGQNRDAGQKPNDFLESPEAPLAPNSPMLSLYLRTHKLFCL